MKSEWFAFSLKFTIFRLMQKYRRNVIYAVHVMGGQQHHRMKDKK